ncbi:MAG: HupE/UreJ family protein, partial [Acidobacteria bacterium]|nr:HupE/UreJ family protein [Acidobacteriota bacterium]NIN70413.1 HupE/UreJ family protein [Gemmatimonadota bacterium]NIQ29240.1 HupE/UreJ family protein [Acidobacteriota bacterium]NIQ83827.1 HupE/UreJ family protein [Acidobacteriota bacterium]
MRRVLRLLTLLLLLLVSTVVSAHEVRPGYLEIRQTGEETFDLTWKVPRRGDVRMAIDPVVPDSCSSPAPTASYTTGNAFVDRWTVNCTGGLVDRTIEIEGLAGAGTDTLVRLQRLDGTVQVELLTPDGPSFTVRGAPSAFGVAATYGQLGVEHILLGIDHLLFVLALLILVDG